MKRIIPLSAMSIAMLFAAPAQAELRLLAAELPP
jgi:hypothetical protein